MLGSKFDLVCNEVFAKLSPRLGTVLATENNFARVDKFQDALRSALLASSVSKYNGNPYFFGGKKYEPMSWDDFGNMVYEVMHKSAMRPGDYSRIEGIIRICRRAISSKELEIDKSIVIFKNCVLDIKSGETFEHHKRYKQVTMCDFDYNKDAYPYMWMQFIGEVLPQKGMQDVLQEFLGSIFVDRHEAKIETMLILYGAGSNGKSVVFNTITGILGKDNVSNFGISALTKGLESKRNLASINGKRLNYCSELQAMEISKESDVLKALISGEPIEARPMYGDNFTARDLPLLMSNANQLPLIKDVSWGMQRRIIIIPFYVEIARENQNLTLARDLEQEYPAIFNWIMIGRKRFIANGYKFSKCAEISDIMNDYIEDNSSVLKFMNRFRYYKISVSIHDKEPRWVALSGLYKKYKGWCDNNDVIPETRNTFTRQLRSVGYKSKRLGTGIVFALFGAKELDEMAVSSNSPYMSARSIKQREKLKALEDGKGYTENGVLWVRTLNGLASNKNVNVSVSKLSAFFNAGEFEGMYHYEGSAPIFDVKQVIEKLVELGAQGKSDVEIDYEKRKDDDKRVMRKTFNRQMVLLNLPLRKYKNKNQNEDKVIVVDDDWQYTEAGAEKIIQEWKDKKLEKLIIESKSMEVTSRTRAKAIAKRNKLMGL